MVKSIRIKVQVLFIVKQKNFERENTGFIKKYAVKPFTYINSTLLKRNKTYKY